jgi:gliding motility-associated-like protein
MKQRQMKNFLPLFLIFFTLNTFSQKEANFWYFGENAGLDFSTNPPTALTDGEINTLEGCSTFSDKEGNLLFYSDGITVYDKNHEVMKYTDGSLANDLRGDPSSTQSGMIIPKPESTSIYYLFTVDDGPSNVGNITEDGKGLNVYTIDLSNGIGEITEGPTDLSDGKFNDWEEKVAAVKGQDCSTYWVVSVVNNQFYSYFIDASGLQTTPVISSVTTSSQRRGYLKLSPDGTKLAIANQSDDGQNSAILYDFNNQTGEVTNNETFVINGINDGEAYGVEFSIDSKKLYISTVSSFRGNLFEPAVTYKLFQFDLTETNIPNSKAIIHQQIAGSAEYPEGGFRGALQLGPDGKIYATIPEAYFNGFAPFLDVIENPTANAADIIFKKNAIDLKGKFSTQGLPPFISSLLLLPIEIKDEDTNNVINNQDLQFCEGQNKTIVPAAVTGQNIKYTWTFDNGTSTIEIPSSGPDYKLILSNITKNDKGVYALKITLEDDCGNNTEYNGTFTVDVFEAASATQPEDIIFCDTDNDGFNTFDLQSNELKDKILTGLDGSNFEILYFDGDDVLLPNPYTNPEPFSSQTILVKVQNIKAPNACYAFTTFKLTVTGLPIPETPLDYAFCDNTSVGSDTDGFVNDFILESKDAEILGTLDPNQYNVSYHTSENGAQTNASLDVIDKTSNYKNTTVNTQPIYVRVENVDNTACFDASKAFNLIVNTLPVVADFAALLQCDDDLDRVSTINLTEAEISISTNYQNETFQYFATQADAIAGTPIVVDELRYPVNQNGEAWVRTISNQNCYRISKINLEVEAAADVAYNKEFTAICDDFLQTDGTNGTGNNDTDGITNFDFSDADSEILAFFPAPLQPDLEITYYETRADRTAVVNAIADIANYRNINYPSDVTRQTIYFKITNKNNNNCSGTGELYLKTNPVPSAETVPNLELCDDAIDGDGTNGIVQFFDLESQTAKVLNGQNPTDFAVTYHLSEADATAGNNAQASPFANTVRDLQTIYVRVTNNTTSCFTNHTSFNLTVNPIPIANFVVDLEICDDNSDGSARNGFSQSIDLESKTNGILGTQDPSIYAVTYHRSLTDAQAGNNPLISPYSNIQADRETIFVRVYNAATMCANGISNFDVIVNPEPIFDVPTNLSYCDDALDGDDANGIIQTIDLDGKITEILGTSQDPDDFIVTFHANPADASTGNSAIDSPYTNLNATETIFVRIQNKATLCINDDASFDVIINPLPDFTVTTPQILCLNNLPLNIAVENAMNVYSYVWKNIDGDTISTADNVNVTVGGTYTVAATSTNGTLCTREETITISESSIATLEMNFVTIVDESNNIGSQNNLSISIDTINNNLGPGDYQFAILNTDDNMRTPFAGYQEEPIFQNLEGGIYEIIVNDKNGCSPDTKLLVSVIQFPKFFTPNSDGENDYWLVKGANKTFYPNSSINIFNRYGKLVAQLQIDEQGWDGTYNGKTLSSDDYWFSVTLIPADKTKPTINKKGNFSLIRK